MTPAEREEFLRAPRTAVLATTRADGSPHVVPVWFTWDGQAFHILTGRGSVKHRNVVRTGRAALCVDQRDGVYVYVTAEGRAEIVDGVTREDRLALWTHYEGPERGRESVDKSPDMDLVMIVLQPDRWLS
jgi:PPOX class probable F420-dependent enzyme